MAIALTAALACGGGGGSRFGVEPASVGVRLGQTQAFRIVNASASSSFVWSLAEGPECGSVDQDGVYTAPAALPGNDCHVVATGGGTQRTAAATVMLIAAEGLTVAVSPDPASVGARETKQFAAVVSGCTNLAVTWSVSDPSTCGSIDEEGLYTPPPAIPDPAACQVVATSIADPSASRGVALTIFPVSVTVSPRDFPAQLFVGGQQQFTATVSGATDQTVTWSLVPDYGWDPPCGAIDQSGFFTATSVVSDLPLYCLPMATSNADASKWGWVRLHVVSAYPVVEPAAATVHAGATQEFTYSLVVAPGAEAGGLVFGIGGDCGTVLWVGPGNSFTYRAPAAAPAYACYLDVMLFDGGGGQQRIPITVVP